MYWFRKNKPSRTADGPGKLDIPGSYNLRELGGYPAAHGRTLYRRFLRSGSLRDLTAAGNRQLYNYGVRAILDLRGKGEVAVDQDALARRGDVSFRNVELYAFDMSDPKLDRGDDEGGYLAAGYFTMLANHEAVREIFEYLGAMRDNRCLLFHCSAGMDRTGVVAMLVLGLVGVPREVIVADYAYSFGQVDEVNAAVFGGRDNAQGALALRIRAIEVTYDRLVEAYGSVRNYLLACGVPAMALDATERHLLV